MNWRGNFIGKDTAVLFDGIADVGKVQRVGGSWFCYYGDEEIAVRPTQREAQDTLLKYHAEVSAERARAVAEARRGEQ